jgi:PAS domain S-box-containing protein
MAINPGMFEAYPDPSQGDIKPYPKRLVISLAILIFFAEVIAMIILYYLRTPNYFWHILMDATMMLMLVLPGLYLLQLRPLIAQIEKRDQVERALRSNQELLRKVLELLPVGVLVMDRNHKIVHGNPESRQIWEEVLDAGYEGDLEIKAWWAKSGERVKPDERPSVRAIQRGETSLNEEIEFESIHGARKIILNSAIPILDDQRSILGAVVVNHDITDRRQVQKERDRLSALLERFFSSISTLIAYMDRDFNFIRVNDTYAMVGGHPPEFYIGKNHFDLFPYEENVIIFRRVVETGEPYSVLERKFEYAEFPERGASYWDWSLQPVTRMDGWVEGVVLSLVDVTERKHAQIRLATQNEELRGLIISESNARQLAETLSAASLALAESLDLEHVLNTLLEHIHKIVPADTAILSLLEDEFQLSVRKVREYDGSQACEQTISSLPVDGITDSVLHRLKSTHKSMIVPNTLMRTAQPQPQCIERIRFWLIVPISASQKTIGLVELGRATVDEFTSEHIKWVEAIVSQAAVAIQNAWLFEQARLSSERLQSLTARLVEVQENEREHISRELHDESGQALASIKMGLGRLELDPDCSLASKDRLHELRSQVDGVLEGLHRIAMDLRPVALDHVGLVAALQQYFHKLECKQPVIKFKAVGFDGRRLPRDVETSIYRIVQEATTNVLRHAHASNLGVLVELGENLRVFVEDDGVGFDPAQVDFSQHLGLAGMQERAEMLGGRLILESSAGIGTSLIVEVPNDNPNTDR